MTYLQVTDGDWIKPKMKKFRMACCNCGLTHDIDFKIEGNHVLMRINTNNRATAAMRRKK